MKQKGFEVGSAHSVVNVPSNDAIDSAAGAAFVVYEDCVVNHTTREP